MKKISESGRGGVRLAGLFVCHWLASVPSRSAGEIEVVPVSLNLAASLPKFQVDEVLSTLHVLVLSVVEVHCCVQCRIGLTKLHSLRLRLYATVVY